MPERPGSMTDRDRRAYMAMMVATTGWSPDITVAQTIGWPERVPPFVVPPRRLDASALQAAPDGRLLVRRFPPDESTTRYDVIDRRHGFAGHVVLPVNHQIVGVGARGVYVAVTDEEGLQQLHRHPWP